MNIKDLIKDKLIEDIGQDRFLHCLRVEETAIILGEKYNIDINKVKTAAILHDCAKFKEKKNLLKMACEFDIILDDVQKINLELIHSPLGAKIAQKKYGVEDQEILDAIKYHTTGRKNMTMLDKIIYIADYIEVGRDFPGVDRVREMVMLDLDAGILLALENTIKYLMEKNMLIHVDTINARNDFKILIEKSKSEGGK